MGSTTNKYIGHRENLIQTLVSWIREQIFDKRMASPLGVIGLLGICFFNVLVIVKLGQVIGIALIILEVSVAIAIFSISTLQGGFVILVIAAFLLAYITRYFWVYTKTEVPLGTVIDGFIFLLCLGVILDKVRKHDFNWKYLHNPISIAIVIYVIFLLLQALNPNLHVLTGWSNNFRRVLSLIAVYFLTIYLYKDKKFLRLFINLWIILGVIGGFYGCTQKWWGFLPMEKKYIWILIAIEGRNPLIHFGTMRYFSLFPDATVFGIFMVITSLLCIIMLLGKFSTKKKILLAISLVFLLLGMSFSGTRTSYAMLPSGVIVFVMMTMNNKKTLIFIVVSSLSFLFILYGPISGNETINRIRTTFQGDDDTSMNLRNEKRKIVQPIMVEYPFGGGIESSGFRGRSYDPSHFLTKINIDSGYVKTAIETGWIGLIIFMLYYLAPLITSVYCFYRVKEPELKTYIAAFTTILFTLLVAYFVQKSIDQYPHGIMLYGMFAIIGKTAYEIRIQKNNEKSKELLKT